MMFVKFWARYWQWHCVHQYLNLVVVVPQIVTLVHFVNNRLTVIEEEVGQKLCLVNVAKGFYASVSFLQLLKTDAEHGIYYASLILLQYFGICIGSWSSSVMSIISQRSMDANILNLNLQRLKFHPLNLLMILVALLSNDVIYPQIHSQNILTSIFWPIINPTQKKN